MSGSARRTAGIVFLAILGACSFPDDGVDNGADGGSGGQSDPQAFLFDESVIRTYEVEVAPSDWAWLNDNERLKEYVPGTLHFEGEVVEQVALRYKGNVGSLETCFDAFGNRTCSKLSMKLKFSEYDRDQKFHGVKRLNFHSMIRDPSHMRDAISYKLFRDAGVPAPRTAFAWLVVNGENLGLFVVVEQIDGRFSRVRFPDGGKGNIYKEIWPIHDTEQPYVAALKSNRNEPEPPSADRMVRFAAALRDATDETFESVLEQWTDIDALMSYHAVARAVDHWDDVIGWYCIPGQPCYNHNYFWYESTDEDRLWLVAWDLDHSFMEPSPIRTYFGMPDWDDTDAHCEPRPIFFGISGRAPACDDFLRRTVTVTWDRYVAATQKLLDGDFQIAALHARIDQLDSLLADAVAQDPHGPGAAAWRTAVTELRDIVITKRAHIEAKL